VSIATGDINNDGKSEIVTSPGKGGGPVICIFNGEGMKVGQFLAYPKNDHAGIDVSVTDTNADGIGEIVTASWQAKALVKVFNVDGYLQQSFSTAMTTKNVFASASTTEPEIYLGSAPGGAAMVLSYHADGTPGHVKFYPFGKNFTSGTAVAAVSIAAGLDPEIVVAPGSTVDSTIVSPNGKSIRIDISEQRLYRYENGQLIATHRVSTGKWSMPTPIGSFSIRNKIGTAYSRAYHLYMDNWMAITPDGKYGIHSLPYWRLKNGGIYYEGVKHLGVRVSHGCVRLSPAESVEVFRWATVGTPITIQN
jgi:lipoprotein-anchoring transpeptidase ErfK/SrfK